MEIFSGRDSHTDVVAGGLILLILLTVAWVFGPIGLRTQQQGFEYVFGVSSALCGLTLFVVRVLRYNEVSLCGFWSSDF